MPIFLRLICIFIRCILQNLFESLFFILLRCSFTSNSNFFASIPANATSVVRVCNCEMFFACVFSFAHERFNRPRMPQNENHLRRNPEVAFYSQARHAQTQAARKDRTHRSHQNQRFDTKTVSNARSCVKQLPRVFDGFISPFARHTPRFAHSRRYTAATRPHFANSAPAETRRRILVPQCD
jgi:hypothetical protein